MPEVTATVHKDGLHPMEAFKAHHLSQELGMSLDDIFAEGDIRNLSAAPTLPQGALRVVGGHTPPVMAKMFPNGFRSRTRSCTSASLSVTVVGHCPRSVAQVKPRSPSLGRPATCRR